MNSSTRKAAGAAGNGQRSWWATAGVIFDAIFRPGKSPASASCPSSPLRDADKKGAEVRVFFPRCRPIAAAALLFRVKREGFSGCRAEEAPDGVILWCRR